MPENQKEPQNPRAGSPDIVKVGALAAAGLASTLTIAAGGVLAAKNLPMAKISNPTAEQVAGTRAYLYSLQGKYPHNVAAVYPDKKYTDLTAVKFVFTEGRGTFSHLATIVAPGQIREHAEENAMTYNGGSEVTHHPVTVDVDGNGFIVPNPNTSAEADG